MTNTNNQPPKFLIQITSLLKEHCIEYRLYADIKGKIWSFQNNKLDKPNVNIEKECCGHHSLLICYDDLMKKHLKLIKEKIQLLKVHNNENN